MFEYENSSKFKESIGYNNYSPSNTTFKSVSGTGKLKLIKDLELRKQIIDFHTVYTVETKYKNDQQVKYHSDHIVPFFIEHVDLTNPDISNIPLVKFNSFSIKFCSRKRLIVTKE